MKTVVKKINLFSFNELNNEAKQKVKNWYNENYKEAYQFSEMCLEQLKNDFGINTLDVEFSLSYSQGDGFCMKGKIIPSEVNEYFWNNIICKKLNQTQKQIIKNELNYFVFKKNNFRYSYAKTVYIEPIIEYNEYKHRKTFNMAMKNIQNWYEKTCKTFEECGYKYFYETTEEEIQEFTEINDLWFTENGNLYEEE